MALTILERPIGVILGTCVDATINEDYNGFATVNKTAHGLSDNDWVYIQGNVENYNGFWQIDVINSGEFALRNSDGTYVSYAVNADVTYCPGIYTHGWSCVHLPITYKISNNKYPVNSVDTVRTITGLSNNSNFAQLTLSGSLGTFEDLSFIKISNAPDPTLDGVYQIIDKISTSSIIINVAYSTFTNATIIGASIQLYYGNYNVVVQIYAGINASHEWASEKPYELAATLELIPDENNEVFFSINDILKPYVKTENNLLLASLPNNIDAWTNFYIATAEQYDTSNGYTISTLETSPESDQATFEGTAVNAMLEFKNIHSGYLSAYLMTNSTAKFLTLFVIPVLFSCGEDTPDCYNDISFLNPVDNAVLSLRKQWYLNGVLQTTDTESLGTVDSGLFRVPLESNCTYDRVDLTLLLNAPDIDNFSDYTNFNIGGVDWVNGVSALGDVAGTSSDFYNLPFLFHAGVTYTISYNITIAETGAWDSSDFFASLSLQPGTLYPAQAGDADNFNSVGVKTGTLVLTPSVSGYGFLRLGHEISITGTPATGTLTINSLSIDFTAQQISETKSFDIDCGCVDQEIRLSWINNLGGFDYWKFTAQTAHAVDITQASETRKNIFPQWPKSWGENANTIRKQTSRTSMVKKFITSQFLGKDIEDSQDKADAISYIKSSPLVQIVNSRLDRRTVTVDTDSFVKYTDGDKMVSIAFAITYTDEIPSQKG